jgi:hypothetical protein
MAKVNSRRNPGQLPNGVAVADFSNYQEAVAYVERLLLGEFPATLIAIVGTDLTTVERVRARISYGRVALNGAMTGSWLGLLFFVVFGSTPTSSKEPNSAPVFSLLSSILVGAGLVMLIQVIRFSLSKAKRGFASSSQMVAKKYEVLVPSELTNDAGVAYLKGGEVKP